MPTEFFQQPRHRGFQSPDPAKTQRNTMKQIQKKARKQHI